MACRYMTAVGKSAARERGGIGTTEWALQRWGHERASWLPFGTTHATSTTCAPAGPLTVHEVARHRLQQREDGAENGLPALQQERAQQRRGVGDVQRVAKVLGWTSMRARCAASGGRCRDASAVSVKKEEPDGRDRRRQEIARASAERARRGRWSCVPRKRPHVTSLRHGTHRRA
jgi:hypothetical protein